ncbi:glutathione S-transferase family protein [Martelella sp. AD-3]|uniref:glutathione S-transferase family protein n=1 Tax=Martelella sp. AD-3 TaxID=686597 RepID=UPI000467A1DA|nr:glutathione S-transferase family protein [Martelella sp. AD-3]AMM86848.1 glutathione S-transferase [Martelella sp. AD-3]
MLKIWGRATSSNVQALMWTVGELELEHERYDVGFKFGGTDTPEFLAMNPNGLIPVVKDGDDGEALFETGAICRYLAARHAHDSFWPKDPAARAHVDKWAEWGKVTAAAAFTVPIFWAVVRTPAKDRNPEAIARALAAFDRLLGIAEAELEKHAFLAGDSFTLADIMFGHILYRYHTMEIDRPARPAVEAYYAAMTERPAYRDHVMVSYDSLRP